MSRSTFSVLFYANKSKVKNGIVPVMGRITINGTQSQFSCKRSIPLSLWDAKGRSNLFALPSKELRQKQKQEQTVKKRYRTKAPAPRLCADEVMSRTNLIRYQDTYANQMAAYGLQRGIKGSEAQHISTHEYYRSLITQGEDLQANITQLHREVDDLNERIDRLHTDMQKLKDSHTRELNRTNEQHQQEVSNLKRLLDKAYKWSPSFKRFLNMERECLEYGFSEVQTDKLLHGQIINYSGWLHSNEFRRNALANNVTAQVIRDEKRNLFLHINETPIAQWFKEQFGIGQEQTHRRGFRL